MIKFLCPRSGFALTLLISTIHGLFFPLELMAQTQPVVIPSQNRPNNIPRVIPPSKTMPQPSGNVAPGDNIPSATQEMKQTGLDDIKNYPDQLTTWACTSTTGQVVAVEMKEISFWQNLMENNKNWQCSQNLPDIPGQKNTFSCEPTDTMGLISVYWLKGKGGETQMKSWMTALANNHNLVCTSSFTNQFWE